MATKPDKKRDDVATGLVRDTIEAAQQQPRPSVQQPGPVMLAVLAQGKRIARGPGGKI